MDMKLMKKSTSADQKTIFSENYKNNLATKIMRKRVISDKTQLHSQKKMENIKNDYHNNNRFLITINVFGSAGPIRFVANGDDNAGEVIQTALKQYAREERLPVLGSDIKSFFLYSVSHGFDAALEASEAIGISGARNFVLCKKQNINNQQVIERRKGSTGWRSGWIHKHLLSLIKILSH